MRELPLLACDSVALNLREGRQTQHRVPVRPRALWMDTAGRWLWQYSKRRTSQALWTLPEMERALVQHAPWQPGDMRYIRECWARLPTAWADWPIVYRADYVKGNGRDWWNASRLFDGRWRPSIHMPKWAARTWLTVKRVWVERVQDISEEDARAEGVERFDTGWRDYTPARPGEPTGACFAEARDSFASLWKSLYPGSWERNDWLWCCELELDRERSGVGHG